MEPMEDHQIGVEVGSRDIEHQDCAPQDCSARNHFAKLTAAQVHSEVRVEDQGIQVASQLQLVEAIVLANLKELRDYARVETCEDETTNTKIVQTKGPQKNKSYGALEIQ